MLGSIEPQTISEENAADILHEISDQNLDAYKDLKEYAQEPWRTLKEFEQNILCKNF